MEVLANHCKPAQEEYKPVLMLFNSYLPEIISLIWGDHGMSASCYSL